MSGTSIVVALLLAGPAAEAAESLAQAAAREAARRAALRAGGTAGDVRTWPRGSRGCPEPADHTTAEPCLLYAAPLTYPPEALQRRVTGIVVLKLLVAPDGRVADLRVEQTEDALLVAAARENALSRRYRPAVRNGVPEERWIPATYRFSLPPR